MLLSRVKVGEEIRLCLDNALLGAEVRLADLLALGHAELIARLEALPKGQSAAGELLCPAEPTHEIWASGVTYLRSRDARKLESQVADVYEKVYDAERPELFFKALGWRSVGDGAPVRIRADSSWNVPEPELCLVINSALEIVGYCAANDMSSRAIEGANPLYLPQAKMYEGACAIGPSIKLLRPEELTTLHSLPIKIAIKRDGREVFVGETSTAQMKRTFTDLVRYLGLELRFPAGVFLMTGTGLVPPEAFTLHAGDEVGITVGSLRLSNPVTN